MRSAHVELIREDSWCFNFANPFSQVLGSSRLATPGAPVISSFVAVALVVFLPRLYGQAVETYLISTIAGGIDVPGSLDDGLPATSASVFAEDLMLDSRGYL